MEHQKPISKKLFIEELETPAPADTLNGLGFGQGNNKEECELPVGKVTTLALGEECFKV